MPNAIRFALDLFFPPRCLGCGVLGSFFCPACAAKVVRVHDPVCPACRATVDIAVPVCVCSDRCLSCVLAAAEYNGPLRHAIHRFKYKGQKAGARDLAGLLRPLTSTLPDPNHIYMPIPLHPRRERERGYNQSALLANALLDGESDRLDRTSLIRAKRTSPQIGLHAAARALNMQGAFVATPGAYRGHTVILIDDVCTTGATLREAARALKAAGARRVIGLVLAIAVVDQDTRSWP
jgi:ComF family protein